MILYLYIKFYFIGIFYDPTPKQKSYCEYDFHKNAIELICMKSVKNKIKTIILLQLHKTRKYFY